MFDELLRYYETELGYLRELSGEFARRYPKIAGRLQLEGDQCEDPHVERLIEAFAFLGARIHRRLDDDLPEITASLLDALYPHFLQPVPSASIVQFELDPARPEVAGRYRIERGQMLLSPPVDDLACRFRTCYPVELYPLTVASARVVFTAVSAHLAAQAPDATAVLTLSLETQGGVDLGALQLDRLRFFLDGEPALTYLIHQLLLQHEAQPWVEDQGGRLQRLPRGALRPVGFARDEGLLAYDDRSFLGYRLLTEYFTLPEKFLFVDVTGLPALSGQRFRLHCPIRRYPGAERHTRLLESVEARHFRLGCTPVINLFPRAAEPVRVTHRRESYPIVVDARRPLGYEVIAIERVHYVERDDAGTRATEVPPLYGLNGAAEADAARFRWHARRDGSTRANDRGTEVSLHLVDARFSAVRPATEVLSLALLCSNRDLPERLPFGGGDAGPHTDFTLPGQAVVKRVRLLRKPTSSLRNPHRKGFQWRLVSHLSLNYLSIVSQGKGALQDILALYNPLDRPAARRHIEGIREVNSAPAVARLAGPDFISFVRGTGVDLVLDEEAFVGASAYLFASVLERFFALYCAPNSFVQLRYRCLNDEENVVQWPPRSGEAIVI
ncbi:type VI secretion system baseplate subunit TssF [Azoarcus olearius]|uniref:Type VI secretion system baseplate subunit TssF n=1 Tax=Azoarcus sp. (strain BH72) TaxID=418699 RepID=A1K520_AZOSB|nr:type VI secretion system baseplate subunit TssF [Azoarcus olearius]CAL93925.1 conserved hypothetical protein [Azoarcus olearius]